MSDIKLKYPATSTAALAITLASLASSSTLLAGSESDAVDNTTNLDLDHLLTGKITVGTSPAAGTMIEVWAFAPFKIASGTPSWPDVMDGTSSAETLTSDGVKQGMLRLVASLLVDATTSDRAYYFPPTSIAQLFGEMPPQYGIFVTQNTGAALNSTGGNHEINYHRIQKQTT